VKDVTEIRTSFFASSQITVRNYSNKHITIKLIKERERRSQIEGGVCVFICETALGLHFMRCTVTCRMSFQTDGISPYYIALENRNLIGTWSRIYMVTALREKGTLYGKFYSRLEINIT